MVEIKDIYALIEEISPYYAKRKKDKEKGKIDSVPEGEHKLVYESRSETLEPVYFFILDLLEEFGLAPEKLVDNFSSSPGSGHFEELGRRATIMQDQGSKILGNVNTVIRSVLNVIYDLRDFKIRLQSYDDLKSKNKEVVESARLALKQVWMDKVDINKGNSSIKALALGQAGFQTLIDAFLVVDTSKDVNNLDLNDRVRRIVTARIAEFNIWLEQSEKELRKRYILERGYLKSQVDSLKLYSRWVKPYLRAAAKLTTKDFGRDPGMVNVFNTLLLELTLLGKSELKIKDSALEGSLPSDFAKSSFQKLFKRKFYSCVLVDFKFRGIPQRAAGVSHYVFGGKVEVTFRGYALSDDEIAKIYQELDKSDLEDMLGLAEGATEESLGQMTAEIEEFLSEKDTKEDKNKTEGSNPFLALIGYYDRAPKEEKKEKKQEAKEIIVKKDSWVEEKHLRRVAGETSQENSFKIFEIYKKAHGMAAYT